MANPVYSGPTTYEGGTRIYGKDWPVGSIFRGNASYFGGSSDSMDNGSADSRHGIAFPSTATRGGWFLVHAPNGKNKVLQQVEYGPADWVGNPRGSRVVDVLFNTVGDFGYSINNFPTDRGTWTLVYLGKKPKENIGDGVTAMARALGITIDEATRILGESDAPAAGDSIDGITQGVKRAVSGPLDVIGNVLGALGSGAFWIKVAKVTLGAIFVTIALARVTGAM